MRSLQNAVKLLKDKQGMVKLEKYEIGLIESRNTEKLIRVLNKRVLFLLIKMMELLSYLQLCQNSNDMMKDSC